MLAVSNLTKSYRSASETVAVLRGVNLRVAPGESVALTGESGSGKSTLLHLIAGLDAADGGEIRLRGTEITAMSDAERAGLRRNQLGLVFQQYNLIPSLSVEDNLKFQARIAGRHDDKWHAELVERLGLGDLTRRYPEQLSGGQQQRALAATGFTGQRHPLAGGDVEIDAPQHVHGLAGRGEGLGEVFDAQHDRWCLRRELYGA